MGRTAPVGVEFRRAEPRDAEALAQLMADPAVFGGLLQLPYPGVEAWRKRLESRAHEQEPSAEPPRPHSEYRIAVGFLANRLDKSEPPLDAVDAVALAVPQPVVAVEFGRGRLRRRASQAPALCATARADDRI